ncbi:MAG: PTS sugar transporter subunit IIA [Lactobacillus sp.]|nr:PTS sugar transporter subunit IIA [Lactobacillus sp.]MCI2032324.1 PTS sugar transporter subunit IIA [Lactobacillus sp.]
MEVIMVGHANTAIAFKEAVEMIFGKVPNFHPLSFQPGEGLASLTAKIEAKIDPQKREETLIVVDLFSGTPYNAAAGLVLHHKAEDVIAGMCLPMLLELATSADNESIPQVVMKIEQEKPEFTKVLSSVLKENEEEDDF